MWRALGGLAAIAVLSACAATPTPVHRAEREKHDPPGGDNIDWPTPDTVSLRVAGAAHGNCGAGADAEGRYGSVEVVVRRGPEDRPLIETQTYDKLNEDDRTCVSSAAYQAVESLQKELGAQYLWGSLGTNAVSFSVPLGTPPRVPAIPPPEF